MKEKSTKIELQYGSEVLVLPAAVLDHIDQIPEPEAQVLYLRVLMLLAADPALREDADEGLLAERLGAGKEEVHDAIVHWRAVCLLKCGKASGKKSAAKPAAKPERELPPPPSTEPDPPPAHPPIIEAPYYTPAEIETLFARHSALRTLIEDCKAVLGGEHFKNEYDYAPIVTLVDHYGLTPEYVLFFFNHCSERNIKTVSTCYNYACRLMEQGIFTEEELESYLTREKRKSTIAGKLKGHLDRPLSSSEKRFADSWGEAGYSWDLILYAYDTAIDRKAGKPLSYMNRILLDWGERGITTPAQAAKDAEEHALTVQSEKAGVSPKASTFARSRKKKPAEFSSFDADAFLAASVAASDARFDGMTDEEILRQAERDKQKDD